MSQSLLRLSSRQESVRFARHRPSLVSKNTRSLWLLESPYSIDSPAIVRRPGRYVVDQGDGDVDMTLLNDEDLRGQVAGLILLVLREALDARSDEKYIRQIVQLVGGDVRLLEDVAVEPDIPTAFGPIRVGTVAGALARNKRACLCRRDLREIENLRRCRG